jgi:hypothetical protein
MKDWPHPLAQYGSTRSIHIEAFTLAGLMSAGPVAAI